MLGFLQQPYVFALVVALVTAVLAYSYSRVTDADASRHSRTFFRTLAAASVAGLGLAYLASARSAPVMATEPFDAVLPAPAVGGL